MHTAKKQNIFVRCFNAKFLSSLIKTTTSGNRVARFRGKHYTIMRKIIAPLLLISATLLIGCHNKQKQASTTAASTTEPIQFDTLKVKKSFPLDTIGSNSPELKFDIRLLVPQESNKEIARNISNGIVYAAFGFEGLTPQEAADSLIATAKREYYELRNNYLNIKDAMPAAPYFNAYHLLFSEVAAGRSGTICYTITNETYNGGAHPASFVSTINFDTRNGKEIALHDILKEDCDSLLTTMLTTRLAQQHGLSTIEELQKAGYLTMNDMFVTSNFILAPDSLFFLYNSYEIAPYALGRSLIGFTYDELKDILK